jgi:hypothetical protein
MRAIGRATGKDESRAFRPPECHWRSYGNDPLSTGQEAMAEPFRAFPSWFLRIE